MIEVGLDGGSQSAVIPRPQFADTSLPGFGRHREDVVGLFEVKGETHGIPAALELRGKLGARRIFQDIHLGQVLPQESQAKRDRPWHSETPAKIPRRILAKIIVEAGVAATRCQQNSRQVFPPLWNPTTEADAGASCNVAHFPTQSMSIRSRERIQGVSLEILKMIFARHFRQELPRFALAAFAL